MGRGNDESSCYFELGHGRPESRGSGYTAQPYRAQTYAEGSNEVEDDFLREREEKDSRA